MTFLTTLAAILFFISCTVDVKSPLKVVEVQKTAIVLDSDGDGVDDDREIIKGSPPMIANVPQVSVDFVGEHVFTLDYRDLEQESDTQAGQLIFREETPKNVPLMRLQSLEMAAGIGAFSEYATGNVPEDSLFRVATDSVPLDTAEENIFEIRKILNPYRSALDEITLELEITITLAENRGFSEIKNPVLNFYHRNHARNSLELIHSRTVERRFYPGIVETVPVTLERVLLEFFRDGYIERGEFLIAELADFDIPELATTRKRLLAGIREKTVPVVINTPTRTSVDFVATGEEGMRLGKLLETLLPGRTTIERDKIKKIGIWESNLPDYEHLSEVKNMDRRGKWFVVADGLKGHWLDHRYTPGDMITLTYATGKALSSRIRRVRRVHIEEATSRMSGQDGQYHLLGHFLPGSTARIRIRPLLTWGQKREHWKDSFGSPGGSCGSNCISMDYRCEYEFNIFESFERDFTFTGSDLSRIVLVSGEKQYHLNDLDKNAGIKVSRDGNILQIDLFSPEGETASPVPFGIRLLPFAETTFDGIKLVGSSGSFKNRCIDMTLDLAEGENWPISVESEDFERWKHYLNPSVIKIGETQTYHQHFSVAIESAMEERFN